MNNTQRIEQLEREQQQSHRDMDKLEARVSRNTQRIEAIEGRAARVDTHEVYELIAAEVAQARAKFPGTEHLTVALMEEVGELAQALLKAHPAEVLAEAIQVAAVAVRIIEEGDASFDGWGGE